MRKQTLALFSFIAVLLFLCPDLRAQQEVAKQLGDSDMLEEALKKEFADERGAEPSETIDQTEEEIVEPEGTEEELPLEEPIRPILPTHMPFRKTPMQPTPAATGEGEESLAEAMKVIIDLMIDANYVFENSPDSFDVKYHIQVESKDFSTKTSVFRGDAEIEAKVTGFLAKWDTGECKLDITIPKTPFQATVRQSEEEKLSIDFKFTKKVSEQWKSTCSFGDAEAKPFETIGANEEWFQKALAKSSPPLTALIADAKPGQKSVSNFVISTHTFNDPPIGSVEVTGKGTITVISGEGAELSQ